MSLYVVKFIRTSVQTIPGLANFHVSGATDPRAYSSTIVPLNVWKNITLTYQLSSQTLKTYIDGVIDSKTTGIPTPNAATSVAIKIGTDAAGNPYFFHGKIDDIKIYDRTLTDCDIDSLYNMPNPLITGKNETENVSTMFIYPNPTTGKINLNTTEVVDIRIYNNTGQVVKSIQNSSGQIDVSDLNNGIYFLQMKNQNSTKTSIYKFVKN